MPLRNERKAIHWILWAVRLVGFCLFVLAFFLPAIRAGQGASAVVFPGWKCASVALTESPKKQAKKGRRFGRKVMVVVIGGGVALIASEKLRSKVLDPLFGAEEEFEYTPPATATSAPPATPVSPA